MCVALDFEENTQIVASVKLERCVTRTGVHRVVVGKLRHQEERCLVILLLIYKSTKVCFYPAILAFRLSVGLSVERGRESLLDVKQVVNQRPELEYKNRFLFTYDGV